MLIGFHQNQTRFFVLRCLIILIITIIMISRNLNLHIISYFLNYCHFKYSFCLDMYVEIIVYAYVPFHPFEYA